MFRLHFTDAALAQLEALGLDQDAVRRAIIAGSKAQMHENLLLVRHRVAGLEVVLRTLGADYEVVELRRWQDWQVRAPDLPYLRELGGPA